MAKRVCHRYGLFLCLILSASATEAIAGQIQFGLAELPGSLDPHGDSFVITIPESETELISHARALVDWVAAGADPLDSPGSTILVTEMVAGGDGINRNYLAANEEPWSWRAVGLPSFADNTIEILDGWPTFVEQDVDGWIANTNGYIGFWNYTVTAELGPVVAVPEPSSVLLGLVALGAAFSIRIGRTVCDSQP
jgi:hypothetical protein